MADLRKVLLDLAKQAQGPAAKDDYYQPGRVLAVNEDGTYRVETPWGQVIANPETDVPLTPGQAVRVSKVENGKPVIHGPRYD